MPTPQAMPDMSKMPPGMGQPPAEDAGGDAQGILDSISQGFQKLDELMGQAKMDPQDKQKLAEIKGQFDAFVQYLQQPEDKEVEAKPPGGQVSSDAGAGGVPMSPGM